MISVSSCLRHIFDVPLVLGTVNAMRASPKIFFLSFLFSSYALADALDAVGIAYSPSTGDGFVGISLVFVVVILIAAFSIGILSLESFPFSLLAKLHGHIHAANLFLKVRFSCVKDGSVSYPLFSSRNNPEEMEGFLRSLDFQGATIVLKNPIPEGSLVRLDLGSLPRFYHGRYQVAGEVLSVKKIGDGKDYLAQIHFASIPQALKEPLTNYLKQLTAS